MRIDYLRYLLHVPFVSGLAQNHQADTSRPRFFFDSADVRACAETLKQAVPEAVEDCIHRAREVCHHRFDLLGYSRLEYGKEVDWHRDPVHQMTAPREPFFKVPYLDFNMVGDSKITWELNRHQHFVTLAKAWCYTNDPEFVQELIAQWESWIRDNPYPIGTNWASSLEVGFRTLSWLWVKHLLPECPHIPGEFWQKINFSLAVHGRHIRRYLSTYFSPNTHLLGEGVALFFLGILCPHLPGAKDWRDTGWRIVLQEAGHQVLLDGMHFEQSVYYHVYALDFLLHARILAERNRVPIPNDLDQTLQKMLEALAAISFAGPPPSFGDDDGGRVFDPRRNRAQHLIDPLATGALLFYRPDFKQIAGTLPEETVWLLGPETAKGFERLPCFRSPGDRRALPSSGIYSITSSQPAPQRITIDAGPLGRGSGGHGHADLLSLVFVADGCQWLIDPGTCAYVGPDGTRDKFRGTAAHNSLQVDATDQAVPIRPFAWTSLPRATVDTWVEGKTCSLFSGQHDGYWRLPKPIVHRRGVFHSQAGLWLVRDRAEGTGVHDFELNWHFAPGVELDSHGEATFASRADARLVCLSASDAGVHQEIGKTEYSPTYGSKQPCRTLRMSARASAPIEFASLWLYEQGVPADLGQFERVVCGMMSGGVSVYRYTARGKCHHMLFATGLQPWTFGPWHSDAQFVHFMASEPAAGCELAFIHGSFLEFDGERVLSFPKTVPVFEYPVAGDSGDIYQEGTDYIATKIAECIAGLQARLETVLNRTGGRR